MKKLKPIPKFKSEDAERAFWSRNDSTRYVDWSKAESAQFPNLKPSVRSVSVKLPESLVNDLKVLANKRAVSFQSLMKIYLSEKVQEEYSQ
jgi:hypothetical protein